MSKPTAALKDIIQKAVFNGMPPIEVTSMVFLIESAIDGRVKMRLQVLGKDDVPLIEQDIPAVDAGCKLTLAGNLQEMLNFRFSA